jgi:hypothetical protein
MIDRYEAIAALRRFDFGTKCEFLIEEYAREHFPAIRQEIIAQLAADTGGGSLEVIRKGLHDAAASVRACALDSIREIPSPLRSDVEGLLADSSYAIVASALTRLSGQFPASIARYLDKTNGIVGPGHLVAVRWHELNAGRGATRSIDSLIGYTSNSNDFTTRLNALEALKRLDVLSEPLIAHLFDAMLNPNGRLSGPATSIAQYFWQQNSKRAMLQTYASSHSWRPWQKAILDKALN